VDILTQQGWLILVEACSSGLLSAALASAPAKKEAKG